MKNHLKKNKDLLIGVILGIIIIAVLTSDGKTGFIVWSLTFYLCVISFCVGFVLIFFKKTRNLAG